MDKVQEAFRTLGLSRRKPREMDKFRAEITNALENPSIVRKESKPMIIKQGDDIVTIRPAFKKNSTEYQNLLKNLIDWINNELAYDRILIQSIEEDLFDGLVLAKLIGKIFDCKQLLSMQEIIPSETGQLQRIRSVLQTLHEKMQVPENLQASLPWSAELIHAKDELAIVRLLIAIARHQHAPVRLPESLMVDLDVLRTSESAITHSVRSEDIAVSLEFTLSQQQFDEIDDLFESNPDGVPRLCMVLASWINEILRRISLEIDDIIQLHDGVYLLMLIGFLEGYYIPTYEYKLPAKGDDEKLHNVRLAFELLTDAGIFTHPRVRPADIVNKDLRSITRFLVHLYQSYRARKEQREQLASEVDQQYVEEEDDVPPHNEADDYEIPPPVQYNGE